MSIAMDSPAAAADATRTVTLKAMIETVVDPANPAWFQIFPLSCCMLLQLATAAATMLLPHS